jgi:hypothetical protein
VLYLPELLGGISHPRVFTTATEPHVMSSATDLESGQSPQVAPRAGAFCSPSSLSYRPEALTDLEEGVGGNDSALPVHEEQPVVSQAETLDETSSSAYCSIPSGVSRPFTSMHGGSNIDHSQRSASYPSTQTGQGSSQAEAQIRAYFLTIPETSLA